MIRRLEPVFKSFQIRTEIIETNRKKRIDKNNGIIFTCFRLYSYRRPFVYQTFTHRSTRCNILYIVPTPYENELIFFFRRLSLHSTHPRISVLLCVQIKNLTVAKILPDFTRWENVPFDSEPCKRAGEISWKNSLQRLRMKIKLSNL